MTKTKSYTLKEIENAIRNTESLTDVARDGNLEAMDRMIDADRCLKMAKPTAIQMASINLVWRGHNSLAEAGRQLGVTAPAVKYNIDLLRKKMQAVLDKWAELDREDV